MTPKEKAIDLVNNLHKIICDLESLSSKVLSYQKAKECALYAVDKVLKYSKAHGFIGLTDEYEEVKKEINNL